MRTAAFVTICLAGMGSGTLPCDVAFAHAMLGGKMTFLVTNHTDLGHIDCCPVSRHLDPNVILFVGLMPALSSHCTLLYDCWNAADTAMLC